MAISEKSRSVIYRSFSDLLGEEATADMLAQFPSRDVDEPTTRADLNLLRSEMGELRAELRGEMGELRAELRGEMGELRAELRGEMGELRAEMGELRAELRAEMGELRAELRAEMGELRIDMHRLHNRTLLALAALISAATTVLAVFG
jgi:chromosome segregation ATPase